MITNPLIGTWTYRSFINQPEPAPDFNDIKLWEAELVLTEESPNSIVGVLQSGGYKLNVRGQTCSNVAGTNFSLRAIGETDSATAGWIYDYQGQVAPNWPSADGQVPTLVGTVIRTAPHNPNRPADLTYSFIAVRKNLPPKYELPSTVRNHFADRMHRLHHAVWHGLRSDWNDLAPADRQALKDLDWGVPDDRASLFSNRERTRFCTKNGAGEDFLFFHRQMVEQYKQLMSAAGVNPIVWREIPQPGSESAEASNRVPSGWSIPVSPSFFRRLEALKSDEYFWSRMRWWEVEFKNPGYLATVTLGELGALIEYGVHNDMHIRWSAVPRDPISNAPLQLGRPSLDIDAKWDDPKYDWLGEFYSSHVNPIFWRLHGWVDDRIEDWYVAHEQIRPGGIKRVEKGGVRWFEPGPWVHIDNPWVWPESLGGIIHGGHHDPALRKKRIESMEQVIPILFQKRIRGGLEFGSVVGGVEK